MATTMKKNLVIPEVLQDMIAAELPNAIRFSPLATIDNTLEGSAGDTITIPRYAYIGAAADLEEAEEVTLKTLSATTQKVTVKKVATGVEISDEAKGAAHGNPAVEIQRQLTMAVAEKVDHDSLAALKTGTQTVGDGSGVLSDDLVGDALDVFSDEDAKAKVLVIHPRQVQHLRGGAFDRQTPLGDSVLLSGTIGTIYGAQVILSRQVPLVGGKYENYLVKPGALGLFLKRRPVVEFDRDITRFVDVYTISHHYVAALMDESKVVKISAASDGSNGGVEG